MLRSTAFALIAMLNFGAGVAADASPAKPAPKPAIVAKPKSSATDIAPRVVFAKIAQAFASSQSISYTSTLNYETSPGAHTICNVAATAQKPNQMKALVTDSTGASHEIVVGPLKGYVVDTVGKRYASFDTRSHFRSELQTARVNGYELVDSAVIKSLGSVTMLFDASNFDISMYVDPGQLWSHIYLDRLHNQPVYRIVQQVTTDEGIIRLDAYVNTGTLMPVESSETIKSDGKSDTFLLEDFSAFSVSKSPADPALFSYAPTSDMVAYTAPAMDDGDQPLLADGTIAPDFSVLDEDGKASKLSDFAGKVVVIDFWATWCEPCQIALPTTDQMAKVYEPQGVVFLPICSWDTKDKFDPWVANRRLWTMSFFFDPAAKDRENSIAVKLYSASGIPTQYIIGKDGRILTSFEGYDPDPTDLKQALERAVAGS